LPETILATAQFEVDGKDLVLAALDDFRASAADFSDCLIGRRNRAISSSSGSSDARVVDKCCELTSDLPCA
jgi:predicted nucleic-acid-binding protein